MRNRNWLIHARVADQRARFPALDQTGGPCLALRSKKKKKKKKKKKSFFPNVFQHLATAHCVSRITVFLWTTTTTDGRIDDFACRVRTLRVECVRPRIYIDQIYGYELSRNQRQHPVGQLRGSP